MAKTPEIDIRNDYGRNYIINGNFDFWQRGTSITPITDASITYLADRFFLYENGSGYLNYEQSTDVPNQDSTYSAKITVNTTGTHTAAQSSIFEQRIEGYMLQSLRNKAMTFKFYVKSSITGTYCVYFKNVDETRSLVKEYTIDQADTWELKTITITHDDTGNWNYTTGIGLRIGWTLGSGSNFVTTSDTWQNGNFIATSNQTDFLANAGATFQVSQVMLTEGSESNLPFRLAGGNIAGELALCQRYYEAYLMELNTYSGQYANGTFFGDQVSFNTTKRVKPTCTYQYVTASQYWVVVGVAVYSASTSSGITIDSQVNGWRMRQNRTAGGTTPTNGNFYVFEAGFNILADAEL